MTDYLEHVIDCVSCGERWCVKCDEHWAGCPCPGPHEDTSEEDVLTQLEEAKAKTADGFEGALIGIGHRCSKPSIAVYDRGKCLAILMKRDGMTYEGAVEFFDFNVVGAWVGDRTPIFVDLVEGQDLLSP